MYVTVSEKSRFTALQYLTFFFMDIPSGIANIPLKNEWKIVIKL